MGTAGKRTGRASSVPEGLAISGAVSMAITLAGAALIAGAIHREKMTWEQAGYWIMGMLFAAAFFGSKCAITTIKGPRVVVCLMSGMLFWGLLLCVTALFFGGDFSSIWETAGILLAGCGCAGLLTVPEGKYGRRKVRNVHR